MGTVSSTFSRKILAVRFAIGFTLTHAGPSGRELIERKLLFVCSALPLSQIIPVLAGVALCGGGVGAVFIDYLDQRREQRRRVVRETILIRNLSTVTGDPRSLKAWVFLLGAVVYAILGGVTGALQAHALDDHDVPEGTKAPSGLLLTLYPVIIGVSGASLVLGVRLLPWDTHFRAGIIFNVVAAGSFQMFCIMYGFVSIQLATAVFGAGAEVTHARQALTYVSAACLGVSFLSGGYVMGKNAQLIQHSKLVSSSTAAAAAAEDEGTLSSPSTEMDGTLTPAQVWTIKKMAAALAVVQLSMGIAVSTITVTGVAEVGLL